MRLGLVQVVNMVGVTGPLLDISQKGSKFKSHSLVSPKPTRSADKVN